MKVQSGQYITMIKDCGNIKKGMSGMVRCGKVNGMDCVIRIGKDECICPEKWGDYKRINITK